MTDLLLGLALAAGLLWSVYIISLAALDAHHRGVARVHRGRSWDCRCAYSALDHADGRCERQVAA
jgi:hypothetical protein